MKKKMESKEMNQISDTLLKGKVTELHCQLWLLEHGYLTSTPDVPYQYDFIVDVKGKLLKIQVKTATLEADGSGFRIRVCSITHNSNGYIRRNYSSNDVDYFMTYCNDQCYLIPFSECGVKEKKIRFFPPKNGQVKGISFAKDFLAENILKKEEVVE